MRCVVQRVSSASVDVGSERIASIGQGLLVLVGVTHGDTDADAQHVAQKIANLRIFSDAEGKMNLSAIDRAAEALVVSQFTLYANVRRGRRPSFVDAALPDTAAPLVERVVDLLRQAGLFVQSGQFGAEMAVGLVNDGPVTIWLDTSDLRSRLAP